MIVMARLIYKNSQDNKIIQMEGHPYCFWYPEGNTETLFRLEIGSIIELGGIYFCTYTQVRQDRL